MNINARSAFILTKECLPHLLKTKGNIVHVSSVTGTNESTFACHKRMELYNFNNHFDNVDNYSYLFSGIRAFPNVVAYNMRWRQFESAIVPLVVCLLKNLI